MADPSFWSGVSIAMQSEIGSAQTITGISKANPGVVTHSATDPTDGDYVLLSVEGMHQVDSQVVRVDTVVASTSWELEGVDTSNFDTFSSGSWQVLTLGTTLSTMTDVTASGGEPEFADITTIHDQRRKRTPVIVSPFSLSFTSMWDPSDAGLSALKTASQEISRRAFLITFSNGKKFAFNGYVSAEGIPTGGAQELVTQSVTIESDGAGTFYAS